MTARATPAVLLALGTAFAIVGCGGGDGGEQSSSADAGPLAAIMEKAYGDWDEDTANAEANRVEEVVAACMAEQGFDYTPVDQSQQGGSFVIHDELDVEWGTIEFAEQYGYGITTDPWGQSEEEMPPPEMDEWFDPNQEYVEAMSESEQTAYYAALWGEPTYSEEGEMEEYDWQEHGCHGKAQHEIYEGGVSDEFADLQDEMNSLWEQIESDPRRGELDASWAACMAEAGHSGYATIGDPENQLYEEMNKLWEEATPDVDDPEAWEAIDQQVQERQKELTPREIELAVADFTCREEVRYDAEYVKIQHDHEQRFVDAHGAELEAWAEAIQASRS